MNSTAEHVEAEKKKVRWWSFPLHQLLSIVGVPALSAVLLFAVTSPSRARWTLTETPFFPVQILVALVLATVLQRILRHRTMEWVWVLPLLVLGVSFVVSPFPFSTRLNRYFGSGCRPELRCFIQLAITLPLYSSIAYSLGAFLSRKLQRRFAE